MSIPAGDVYVLVYPRQSVGEAARERLWGGPPAAAASPAPGGPPSRHGPGPPPAARRGHGGAPLCARHTGDWPCPCPPMQRLLECTQELMGPPGVPIVPIGCDGHRALRLSYGSAGCGYATAPARATRLSASRA